MARLAEKPDIKPPRAKARTGAGGNEAGCVLNASIGTSALPCFRAINIECSRTVDTEGGAANPEVRAASSTIANNHAATTPAYRHSRAATKPTANPHRRGFPLRQASRDGLGIVATVDCFGKRVPF